MPKKIVKLVKIINKKAFFSWIERAEKLVFIYMKGTHREVPFYTDDQRWTSVRFP